MKRKAKKRRYLQAVIYFPLLCALMSGCSYYDGRFAFFDLADENRKTLTGKQAADRFRASVRPKSNLSDAHYRLGLHYQQMGDYEKAIGEFHKALRNDPVYCKAFNGIAMTYDLEKRCEAAHAAYEKAVECAPDAAYPYNNYACSSLICGDYGKGLELLEKAERLAAKDTRIKNNIRIAQSIVFHENLAESAERRPSPEKPGNQQAPNQSKIPPQTDPKIPEPSDKAGYPVALAMTRNDVISGTYPAPLPKLEETQQMSDSTAPEKDAGNAPTTGLNGEPVHAAPSSNTTPVAIEVSNGNGTTGMAKRSAAYLHGHGFAVRSITNAKHFRFERSVIFHKEEHLQAARDLAALIPGEQNLQLVDNLGRSSIGIRILLGRDLAAMRFPENSPDLAEYRRESQSEVLTASNIQVQHR